MDRIRRAVPGRVIHNRRVAPTALLGGLALVAGLALTGCQLNAATTSAPSTGSSGTTSILGAHRATTVYQISSPVSGLVVLSQVGNVTVTGGSGSAASVTEEITYSSQPPSTTRTVSAGTLNVGYTCPVELICTVVYDIQVPRTASVQVTADAGKIVLSGLAGQVTAKADVGLINATDLTGGSVSLTTGVGTITADFAAAPDTIQAVTRVGAITLQVPSAASYTVTANASVGQATIQIPQSPSAPHTISATTEVGAILVTSATGGAAQSS